MSQKTNDQQLQSLKLLIENELKETLLGDILSDSFEMLKRQLESDVSFANFRDYDLDQKFYEEKLSSVKICVQSIQADCKKLELEKKRNEELITKTKSQLIKMRDAISAIAIV